MKDCAVFDPDLLHYVNEAHQRLLIQAKLTIPHLNNLGSDAVYSLLFPDDLFLLLCLSHQLVVVGGR